MREPFRTIEASGSKGQWVICIEQEKVLIHGKWVRGVGECVESRIDVVQGVQIVARG